MENLQKILLGDIAHREGAGIQIDATLQEAFGLMHENGMGVVVVLDGERPKGILTERDAVRILCREFNLSDKAGPYARKTLIAASGTRTIGHALIIMVENNIRRLVVTGAADSFLGVVTQQDLLRNTEDGFFRASLEVRHVLNKASDLVFAVPGERITDVLRRMVDRGVGAVPVLQEGRAVGIITEKDPLRLIQGRRSLDGPVESCMSSPVVTARLDAKMADVIRLMNERFIRRVVVVGEDGNRVVGMLTNRDLARNLKGNYNDYLERKLQHTKEVLNLLPEILFEIIDTGEEQVVVWGNEKAKHDFGLEMVDRPVTDFIPPDRWREIYPFLVEHGRVGNARFIYGKSIFEFSGFYLPLEIGSEKGRIQLIMRDITEEVTQAVTDPLTNIFDRRHINDVLAREIERSRRARHRFSVVKVDVDDFKRINDVYGPGFGDKVLHGIAELMGHKTREYDIVGRYGGEEFIIVMPETGKDDAVDLVDRLRRAIEKRVFEPAKGAAVSVTASFGVSAFTEDGETAEDLLVKADERLCHAKRQGKNIVVSS